MRLSAVRSRLMVAFAALPSEPTIRSGESVSGRRPYSALKFSDERDTPFLIGAGIRQLSTLLNSASSRKTARSGSRYLLQGHIREGRLLGVRRSTGGRGRRAGPRTREPEMGTAAG
jgi:hypothetical protein